MPIDIMVSVVVRLPTGYREYLPGVGDDIAKRIEELFVKGKANVGGLGPVVLVSSEMIDVDHVPEESD